MHPKFNGFLYLLVQDFNFKLHVMFTERVNCLITTMCVTLWPSMSTCERAYEAHSMHEGLFMYLLVYTEEKDHNLNNTE